ncbi:methyltransferase family protein [Fuscibacter oryzae]|uniref:Isoprenylcysteine carboxylmethyltransferase family protein n=1 Tax=Fuscibacter oryzae TaxID=2803939 RepID=A0A8J7MP54_9RHOB|nr:isoprenylcysteine carboxylmethyltransferase family protein [Fuscibacter oryzae]MBL4927378.1 isoprenylcysteine carboxylmethyltransferase family protein [Fuscibacter oryzae]
MEKALERWLDWPQAWAVAALAMIAFLGWVGFPWGFGAYGPGLALACLIVGLWLMASAVLQMRRARTTVNPRGEPTALVTDGVFAISRNPIYLGDTFVLLAASFWFDTLVGLCVVTVAFVAVMTERFIKTEEERLGEAFGDEAAAWFLKTRRWL